MKSILFTLSLGASLLLSSIVIVLPSFALAPPTGGTPGGVFGQYFSNMKTPCTGTLDVITGFNGTMVRTCTPFANMMRGFLAGSTSSAGNVVIGFNPTTGLPMYGPGSPWLTNGTALSYNNGNVGIGTANPTAKLEVNGNIKTTDVCTVGGKCLSAMQTNAVNSNQSCTSGKYVSGFDTTGKIQCTTLPASTTTTVTTGGGMSCTSGHWTMGGYVCDSFSGPGIPGGFSDKKLKSNITPISHPLSNIAHLTGVTWTWKNQEKYGAIAPMGVIAQDVEQVYPELVTEIDGVKTVQYHALIGPLIEAIKELDATNKDQNAKIESLEKCLEALEK